MDGYPIKKSESYPRSPSPWWHIVLHGISPASEQTQGNTEFYCCLVLIALFGVNRNFFEAVLHRMLCLVTLYCLHPVPLAGWSLLLHQDLLGLPCWCSRNQVWEFIAASFCHTTSAKFPRCHGHHLDPLYSWLHYPVHMEHEEVTFLRSFCTVSMALVV